MPVPALLREFVSRCDSIARENLLPRNHCACPPIVWRAVACHATRVARIGIRYRFAVTPSMPTSLWTCLLRATALFSSTQVIFGGRFYLSAFAALRHCVTNMDTLVALGTSVAYGFSVLTVVVNIFSKERDRDDQQALADAAHPRQMPSLSPLFGTQPFKHASFVR
eukprot:6193634-Pleurochrysis_carterae.AAC.10